MDRAVLFDERSKREGEEKLSYCDCGVTGRFFYNSGVGLIFRMYSIKRIHNWYHIKILYAYHKPLSVLERKKDFFFLISGRKEP